MHPHRRARQRRAPHRRDHAEPAEAAQRAERPADGRARRGAAGLRRRRRRSAASSSPAARRRSPPAPTSRRWRSYDFMRRLQAATSSRRNWETMRQVRKPVIAAVAGFALGGGCELAMMCDFVIAADNAKFGQPEIKLGIIPGAGGTQRLPRAVGKAKAMDMVLTGRMMDAAEAERAGLVSRVVPAAELMDDALAAAETICELQRPSVMMAKECGQPRLRDAARRRHRCSSAACSTRCSRPRTRRKAWTPSWPSASPSSSTASLRCERFDDGHERLLGDDGALQRVDELAPLRALRDVARGRAPCRPRRVLRLGVRAR